MLFNELINGYLPYVNTYQELYLPKTKQIKGRIINVRTEPKIQRNELCPCNSGKKFKKCCINK